MIASKFLLSSGFKCKVPMILHEGMFTQPIILTDDYTLVLVQDNRGITLHANHKAFISTNPNLGNHRGRGK